MKRLYIIAVSCVLVMGLYNRANSQTPQQNLDKYWHYRWRLLHYFVVVGPNQGESMPATARNYDETLGSSTSLTWADAPVTLGYYIGVLATEYKLLKNAGQNTDETVWELYNALYAVYRLDAE